MRLPIMQILRRLAFCALAFALPTEAAPAAPPLTLVTATPIGTSGDDTLDDASFAPDGHLYIGGNMGEPPALPNSPRTTFATRNDASSYAHGFVARLSPDGTRLLSSALFAKGSAKITTVQAGARGVYVAGYAAYLADVVGPLGGLHPTPPTLAPAGKLFTPREHYDEPKYKPGTDQRGAPFVLRLSPDLSKIEAATFLEGWQSLWHVPRPLREDHFQPVCLALLSDGDLVVSHDGGYNLAPPPNTAPGTREFYAQRDHISRLSPDLKTRRWTFDFFSPEVDPARASKGVKMEWTLPYMGNPRIFRLRADAKDRFYVAGWSSSRTTQEPWWSPFLRQYSPEGKLQWKAWEFDPTSGKDQRLNGLVSDAFVRSVAVDDAGNLLCSLTGDGGNSVLFHDPRDYNTRIPQLKNRTSGFRGRILFWGAAARINADTRECIRGDTFHASGPVTEGPLNGMRGQIPAWANDLAAAPGSKVLAAGRHYQHLHMSDDAWHKTAGPAGGSFLRLLAENFDELYTTSIPDTHLDTIARHSTDTGSRYAIVGKQVGATAPVTPNALQRTPAGARDGYLLIVDIPR